MVYSQRAEPRTLNPVFATEAYSRELIHRLNADLVHINRATLKTEPALARSWKASSDGKKYTLDLRQGLKFSDGHPFTADDVVFTFQVMTDAAVNSPQRGLLILEGKPIVVRKLDTYRVVFELPASYAAAERLFDSFSILPRHLLEQPFREGKLAQTWGLGTPPSQIAGLGPYRIKEFSPGQSFTLERNPYYWKVDSAGNRLPYLDQLIFTLAGSEDVQVIRFRSGEADILNKVTAKSYAALAPDAGRRGFVLENAGPGFETSFLFFNLNALPPNAPKSLVSRQVWFRRAGFRQAVSAAISREDMVRLVYLGRGAPLGSPVPPGNRLWLDTTIPPPKYDLGRARSLLSGEGFRWASDGALLDSQGSRVQFTIAVGSSNPERHQIATLIQDDLAKIGMEVQITDLESRTLLDKIQRSYDYEACVVALSESDADPNVDVSVWLSSSANHLWSPRQKSPATPWEAEIDQLMTRQIVTLGFAERKKMFDRVQRLAVEQMPMIPLVTPDVLGGASSGLGNFHVAALDHNTLWNIEELYWRNGAGPRK